MTFATTDTRWRAVQERCREADGQFVYGVSSTGVYCRPSCPSRRPLRRNVAFFASAEEAVCAGYRACLRCRPDAVDPRRQRDKRIVRACRLLEAHAAVQSRHIAAQLGLSPYHFQRVFKEQVGVTPQAYRRRILAERAKEALPAARSVSGAALSAGYTSSSRFYAGAGRELGMSAKALRAGGRGSDVRYALWACSLGRVLVAWTARGVCDIALGDTDDELVAELCARLPGASLAAAACPEWATQVLALVDGASSAAGIPTDIRGSAFQERVWSALRKLPPGRTTSYGELALALGLPRSARAVARACAHNRLAVLVPCHRVIAASGQLTGYRWGIGRKAALLARERSVGSRAPA